MSVHQLVVGDSGAGKSTSMQRYVVPSWLSPQRFGIRRPPRPVAVLDPQRKPWPAGCWCTDDLDEWLETLKRSRQVVAVWEECGSMCEEDWHVAQRGKWAATQSRNLGHLVYFLAQRSKQVPPSIRNQCGTVYAFHQQDEQDRRILVGSYGPEFWAANQLDIGQCLVKRPMQKTVKTRFFSVRDLR